MHNIDGERVVLEEVIAIKPRSIPNAHLFEGFQEVGGGIVHVIGVRGDQDCALAVRDLMMFRSEI